MTDADLLREFESLTLPFDQWTHRAHVRVAYLYLRQLPFDQSLEKIRLNIQRYNNKNNVPNTATSGYNETTTVAFLHLIHATIAAYDRSFPTPDSNSFCDTHPQLMTPKALRFFYSPERRLHPDAKTKFVEPDLAPLPWLPD